MSNGGGVGRRAIRALVVDVPAETRRLTRSRQPLGACSISTRTSATFAVSHGATRFSPAIVRRRSGIRLPQLLDPFEGLTRAILGQQVSVAGASTITDRLVRLFSRPVPGARRSGFLAFPTPADVADAGADRLRELGLTRARAATLAGVASRIADGGLDLESLRHAPAEEAQAALEDLPGIGPWTASYVRMRALGDRDAFPGADLGVIKAMDAAGVARRSIAEVAERWRPWRGYATLHSWASL